MTRSRLTPLAVVLVLLQAGLAGARCRADHDHPDDSTPHVHLSDLFDPDTHDDEPAGEEPSDAIDLPAADGFAPAGAEPPASFALPLNDLVAVPAPHRPSRLGLPPPTAGPPRFLTLLTLRN